MVTQWEKGFPCHIGAVAQENEEGGSFIFDSNTETHGDNI